MSLAFGQVDTVDDDPKKNDRYVVWLIPSASENIFGIALGPFGSETICNRNYTKYSHGLNIQLPGQGFFTPLYLFNPNLRSVALHSLDSMLKVQGHMPLRAVHNGLLLSAFGSFTDQVNGIALSTFMSKGVNINGITINLLGSIYGQVNGLSFAMINRTIFSNGLQIGLFNYSTKLHGIQIGVWNVNDKRSFPIVNW